MYIVQHYFQNQNINSINNIPTLTEKALKSQSSTIAIQLSWIYSRRLPHACPCDINTMSYTLTYISMCSSCMPLIILPTFPNNNSNECYSIQSSGRIDSNEIQPRYPPSLILQVSYSGQVASYKCKNFSTTIHWKSTFCVWLLSLYLTCLQLHATAFHQLYYYTSTAWILMFTLKALICMKVL